MRWEVADEIHFGALIGACHRRTASIARSHAWGSQQAVKGSAGEGSSVETGLIHKRSETLTLQVYHGVPVKQLSVFDPWDEALVATIPPRHGGVCSAVDVRLKSIREIG